MKLLFIGGTGIISTACTALAARRGLDLTLLSRGQHASELPSGVKTLTADVNDSDDDARRLAGLLRGIPSKVNLIAFNEYAGAAYRTPDMDRVLRFQRVLDGLDIRAFLRQSRGADIAAACGQLRGRRDGKVVED